MKWFLSFIMKLVMNSHDDTMSAPAVAGGKLKLSGIISAIRAGDVELDCKAVFLVVDEHGVYSGFDFNRAEIQSWMDVKLLMLHLGLHALALQVRDDDPEASAAVAGAAARKMNQAQMLEELRRAAVDGGEDGKAADSKVGKEDCHE